MIGLDDDLTEIEALMVAEDACSPSLKWGRRLKAKGYTVRMAFTAAMSLPNGADYLMWARNRIPDKLTPEARFLLSDLATRDNPRLAADWCFNATMASQAELDMWLSRWSANDLPVIAAEYAAGDLKLVTPQ